MAGFEHLFHLADALRVQLGTAMLGSSVSKDVSILVNRRSLWKKNRARARRLRSDRLKERGVIDNILVRLVHIVDYSYLTRFAALPVCET